MKLSIHVREAHGISLEEVCIGDLTAVNGMEGKLEFRQVLHFQGVRGCKLLLEALASYIMREEPKYNPVKKLICRGVFGATSQDFKNE
jgi:hypothetical protein